MKRFLSVLLCIVMVFGLCACAGTPASPAGSESTDAPAGTAEPAEPEEAAETPAVQEETSSSEAEKPEGMIYLYGEWHFFFHCIDQELEAWGKLYEAGVRHLFIEYSPAFAHIFNLEISGDEDTLAQIYSFMDGVGEYTVTGEEDFTDPVIQNSELTYRFFHTIKERYPETIFHGTDVEHEYDTVGSGYLAYLESVGQQHSEEYARELLACEQGKGFHRNPEIENNEDWSFREKCMAENFIYEFEKLNGQDIMGIYGGKHVLFDEKVGESSYSLATQLKALYGDRVLSTELSHRGNSSESVAPTPLGPLTVNGKCYETIFLRQYDLTGWEYKYEKVVFWRLKDSFGDFNSCPSLGNLDLFLVALASQDHLFSVGAYFVDCTAKDGMVDRFYFRIAPKGFPIISVDEG